MTGNNNQQNPNNINQNGDYNLLNDINTNGNNSDVVAAAKIIADALNRQQTQYNNPANTSQSVFRDRQREMTLEANSRRKKQQDYRRTDNFIEDWETGLTDALKDSVAGGDFKKAMNGALSEFANQFGFEFKDLAHEWGKHVGKQLADSKLGKAFQDKLLKSAGKLAEGIFGKESGSAIISAFKKAGASGSSELGSMLGGAGGAAGGAAGSAGGGLAGQQLSQGALSSAAQSANASKLFSGLGGAVGVGAVAYLAYIQLKPLLDALGDFIKNWGKGLMKDEDLRKKRLANAQERIQKDLEGMAKMPFEILEKAVNEWTQTWDQSLSKVSLTQGYTKEDVYDLYESMSQRLIDEGLGSVIPATDVIQKLNTILDTGLSGRIAEEFAYEATKLNAAIPNQDFTSFASTYAQIAAEVVSQGYDQEVALARANYELEQFASNLLYSSRTLTGGFTTGLKDAQSLFQSSVEIAQSAKNIYNAHDISAVLTAVSGVVGAIAPDLASGLVNNVVQAAIGGNNESIVALRSLAGINASNTEFLQAFTTHPQEVFVQIFKNLASLQSMSPDNYMEVAEGLSSVFGVDMKALARVDFAQLAESVASMQINQASLQENMALLSSGESTTTAEQMKLQEINNTILEEGLAYVIDSEAGRMVQQHMWDEQIANELANTQYAVDLTGSSLSVLEGLRHAVANILNFLNPIGYIAKGITKIQENYDEAQEMNEDLKKVLELGAVGNNNHSYYNLLTQGTDLGLVKPLVEMMGGVATQIARDNTWATVISGIFNPILAGSTGYDWNEAIDEIGGSRNLGSGGGMWEGYRAPNDVGYNTTFQSLYSGFNVGKSALSIAREESKALSPIVKTITTSATEAAEAAVRARNEEFIAGFDEASKTMSYEAYMATAEDRGVSVEDLYDRYGEEALRGYYEANSAMHGAQIEQDRKDDEKLFREQNRGFWDYETGANGIFETAIWLPFLNDNFKPFFDSGARYDQRMDAVDLALTNIQIKEDTMIAQLGDYSEFTVIGALTSINTQIEETFVSTNSKFQKCLADWTRYIAERTTYTSEISGARAWDDLKRAEGDMQNETLLALANAMNVFSAEELQKMDPQLQTNALLGKIIIILEAIMQQNNATVGGLSLIDTISALGLGVTSTSSSGS